MARLDDIRKLQKRARGKEYRLRRNGADAMEVAGASPRMDWAEVKAMSPQKRNAYAKRLENFTARENRLDVLESGEIVPHSVLTETRDLARRWNEKAKEEKERLYKIAPDVRKRMEEVRGGRKRERGAVHGSLDKIEIKEKPKTRKHAMKRLETLRAMVETPFESKRKGKKRNAYDMLRKLGYDSLADYVKGMNDDQFDYLSHATGFWSMLAIKYEEEKANKKGKILSEGSQEERLFDLALASKIAVEPQKPEETKADYSRRMKVKELSALRRFARRSQSARKSK